MAREGRQSPGDHAEPMVSPSWTAAVYLRCSIYGAIRVWTGADETRLPWLGGRSTIALRVSYGRKWTRERAAQTRHPEINDDR